MSTSNYVHIYFATRFTWKLEMDTPSSSKLIMGVHEETNLLEILHLHECDMSKFMIPTIERNLDDFHPLPWYWSSFWNRFFALKSLYTKRMIFHLKIKILQICLDLGITYIMRKLKNFLWQIGQNALANCHVW